MRFLSLILAILFPFTAFPDGNTGPPTTRNDPAGKLLRQWFTEGTAAGNVGDYYDNRDGRHSHLNLRKYPQLQPVPYTEEEIAAGKNYGPASRIYSFPTIGNASLSAPATKGGSLPRIITLTGGGLDFLTQQYLSNQLYIYPEHQDHDPGLNGNPGYGDLYPVNTPYLIISQGSSGSDRPFLNAFALTLASFQPAVKEALVKRRMLSPTLQYIFRMSNKPVASSREDYLTGKAHPTVFRSEWIDEVAMMRRAHEMTLDSIPPVAVLEITDDGKPAVPGEDFFEPKAITSEYLSKTGTTIARIFRGKDRIREMRIQVQVLDGVSRPVRCEWRLLRGDPDRVTIIPYANGMKAVVRVEHHPDLIPAPGTPEILGSRVDIGVFADNGVSLSPPAFLSFYMLPNEYRYYADDELILIDYQALSRETGLPPEDSILWAELLQQIWEKKRPSWSGTLLREALTEKERLAIDALSDTLSPILTEHDLESSKRDRIETDLREQRKLANEALRKAKKDGGSPAIQIAETDLATFQSREKNQRTRITEATEAIARAEEEFAQTLRTTVIDGRSVSKILQGLIDTFIQNPNFYLENRIMINALAKQSPKEGASNRINQALDHLVDRGILTAKYDLAPARSPEVESARHYYLEILNRLALSESVFPTLMDYHYGYQFHDPRITNPQRKVYLP